MYYVCIVMLCAIYILCMCVSATTVMLFLTIFMLLLFELQKQREREGEKSVAGFTGVFTFFFYGPSKLWSTLLYRIVVGTKSVNMFL